MRKILLFLCLLWAFLLKANSDTLYYKGDLEIGNNQKLILTLKIISKEDTTLYFLGSPMQSKDEFAPSKVKYKGDTLSLGFKNLNCVLKIFPSNSEDLLQASFRQGLLFKELTLSKQENKFTYNRPQTPQPPFKYESVELSFKNPESDYTFHGTLTLPSLDGEYPCVVLVSGSGCQNRDLEIFGHRPFFLIADYLTNNGIAVFRYDDRGYGEKDTNLYRGTTMDFAKDAFYAIKMLRTQKQIDTSFIGVFGHSEGGMIAQILADSLDFIILAATPSIEGKNILKSQGADLSSYEFDTNNMTDLWLKYFYEFNPQKYLSKIHIPTLVLQGEKDKQVLCKENIPIMQKLLPKNTTIKTYPQLNHLFQHCQTGEVSEYINIEETFSEDVLKDILYFIKHTYKVSSTSKARL
ncbi:MAG: alpha/beta hydrolase [Bacteroidota bacterium]|nr:alpha/beta hydrolase [Bacteroidota bacterium]